MNFKELLQDTKKLSILFVEDHDELRENTREILKKFFQIAHSAQNGEEALEMYKEFYAKESKYYDIVLSDIQMPRMNGIALVEQLYTLNPKQTILMLSAHDDAKYLIPLINLQVEQFIKKPIDYQDLLSVLQKTTQKLLAQHEPTKTTPCDFIVRLHETCVYDTKTNLLQVANAIVPLTKYEMLLLQLLTQNVGKVYSNAEITAFFASFNEKLDAINIRKLISKLRKKIPDECIESIYGVGYRVTLAL